MIDPYKSEHVYCELFGADPKDAESLIGKTIVGVHSTEYEHKLMLDDGRTVAFRVFEDYEADYPADTVHVEVK